MIIDNVEIQTIQNLHLMAFGKAEGPVISMLVSEFLPMPETISICVTRQDRVVGNIIFTPFFLSDYPNKKCFLLAPLGVLPGYQGLGVGAELIESGVEQLKTMGADAAFVLGHPGYYSLRGFVPTTVLPPFPEVMKLSEAWRVREIQAGAMAGVAGPSVAAEPIMKPMFWDTSDRG